jgi:antitoxin component YwqK of YwqJK toxin-antitoxin module
MLISTELQTGTTDRHVLHKHKNGKPKVVVYVVPGTQEIVKEEVYYETGQTNWIGHFKKELEHGEWTYYWPNGRMKKKETYQNGLEEGTSYEYNEQGILVKEIFYKKGQVTGYRNH